MIIAIIIRTIKSLLSLSLFIKANAEADPGLDGGRIGQKFTKGWAEGKGVCPTRKMLKFSL